MVIALAGSIGDGLANAVLKSLTNCVDQNGKGFGDEIGIFDTLLFCPLKGACTCSSFPSATVCFFYEGPGPEKSCDIILHEWRDNLAVAATFDSISVILVFCLAVTTCVSLCGSRSVAPGLGPQIGQVGVGAVVMVPGAAGGGYAQMGAVYGPGGQPQFVQMVQPQMVGQFPGQQQQQVYGGQPQMQQQQVYGGQPQQQVYGVQPQMQQQQVYGGQPQMQQQQVYGGQPMVAAADVVVPVAQTVNYVKA